MGFNVEPPVAISQIETDNPREAAFLAVLISLREETYVSDLLLKWKELKSPKQQDFNLAREIAFGATRMVLALDYIAEKLTDKQKLSLKLKEKVILRTAVYQFYFMDRIPIYAIVNETVKLAKKHFHGSFVRFLNAVLRRLPEEQIELPQGDTVPDMSIRYSYPSFFVQELVQNWGGEKAVSVLEAGNRPGITMARIRPGMEADLPVKEKLEVIAGTLSLMAIVRQADLLEKIVKSPSFYIQNITPAELLYSLGKEMKEPKRILDLCSSPGGKLIAAHDLYPEAELFANDVSEKKLKILKENLEKYAIAATVTNSKGEEYKSDHLFDLIILDVPCSNSGVLNKRSEARWRISKKMMEQMEQKQLQLIRNAASLISGEGQIWYMTCSILKMENSRLIDKACSLFDLEVRKKQAILPNVDGWDGGFACALSKKRE